MTLLHRPYETEVDLQRVLNWLGAKAAAHPDRAFMHPGDLVWWLRQNRDVVPAQALELFSPAGALLGFVFSAPVTWAAIQGAAHLPAAGWDELLAYAEAKACGHLTVSAHDFDRPQTDALTRHGVVPAPGRLARLERTLGPGRGAAPELPGGFRFADMRTGEIGAAARVELHRAVWHPSKVTPGAYAHLQAAPNYRPELDVAVVSAPGDLAAYALGWYDPTSRSGLLEPVGTHPAFRRQGLGRPLILEVTRRLAALGARRVSVGTRESNVAALGLYRSAGYRPAGFWTDHRKGEIGHDPA